MKTVNRKRKRVQSANIQTIIVHILTGTHMYILCSIESESVGK